MSEEEREILNVVGQNLESLIALVVGFLDGTQQLSLVSKLSVRGSMYHYQFVVAREGSDLFDAMADNYSELEEC